jgi:membrane-associated phospholipid phosphatase
MNGRIHRGRRPLKPTVRGRAAAILVATLLMSPDGATADCPLVPFARLHGTGRHLAQPAPLLLAGGAIVAPLALVPTGGDHGLRVLAQDDLGGRHGLEPVSVLAPYAIGAGLLVGYGVSLVAGACEWQRAHAAMLQGMALTVGTVALLKWSTGRGWPNAGGDPDAPDRLDHPDWARRFEPFQSGLGAWPSGHTAVAFSAAAALRTSKAELGWAAWLGYPIAAAIGAGMWLGDHHFASDIVSGALLGEALGASSGRAYAKEQPASEVLLRPAPRGTGVVAIYDRRW